jgi:uncharacterized protein with PIN domain
MDLILRRTDRRRQAPAARVCPLCMQQLELSRQHVSPARLGAPMTTEFYECPACDSAYAVNTSTGKMKPWLGNS